MNSAVRQGANRQNYSMQKQPLNEHHPSPQQTMEHRNVKSSNVKSSNIMRIIVTHAALFALSIFITSCNGSCQNLGSIKKEGSKESSGKESSGTSYKNKVPVEFYVMSKCPYGVQVEDMFTPVMDELGDYVDLHIDYIATPDGDNFKSLHGQPEVDGNIVQLCAMKEHPQPKKYLKFIGCQNKKYKEIPNNWEKCASDSGLNIDAITKCKDGPDGKALLAASAKKALDRQARGSPTIYIGGEAYKGGRSKTDFMRAICAKLSKLPKACAALPEPVLVEAVVLTDKRCKDCKIDGLEGNLKARFFPKLQVEQIDYNSKEGQKMYKDLDLKYLPAWAFKKGCEKAEKFSMISKWMKEKGEYRILKGLPSKFDPTAEICDNKKDDTGNGKVDCADDTCKSTMTCRPEKKNALSLFIMSECPFGLKAVDSMYDVLENFKGQGLDFDIHYIADKTADGFRSLHGQSEVDEDIRQLCAKSLYPKAGKTGHPLYLSYIWCRNKAISSRDKDRKADWGKCVKDGMKKKAIEACATGAKGKKLLEEDLKIAKQLQVSGSPTWLANNRVKFSGIASDAIKTNICKHNPGLKNCDVKLNTKSGVPASASCGQ